MTRRLFQSTSIMLLFEGLDYTAPPRFASQPFLEHSVLVTLRYRPIPVRYAYDLVE